jgi:transposase
MKTPTKFVKPLTPEQRNQLNEIMKSSLPQRKRMRAHAVLLSERYYSIDQIADIYQVDRDRVSQWIDWWEEHKLDGLDDGPRSGRPPKLNEEEQRSAIEIVREEPPSTEHDLKRIADEISKVIWRKIMKVWPPPDAYQGFKKMTEAQLGVIVNTGPKYRITFAWLLTFPLSRTSSIQAQNTVLLLPSFLSDR